MGIQQIVPGVYQVSLGMVNAFLIYQDGLTLIDTGILGSAPKILDAVRQLGKQPGDIHRILLTHLHSDHVGSAQALQAVTGASIAMHPIDAEAYQQGVTMRAVQPAPGLINRLVTGLMMHAPHSSNAPAGQVDHLLEDGEELADGLRVIHAPGHTAGQVVFFWPKDGGVLICADALSHMTRLGYSFIYEDFPLGHRTLRRLSELPFETAVFSHGKPITSSAAAEFRKKFC